MKYFAIFDKNVETIFQLQWKIANISDISAIFCAIWVKFTEDLYLNFSLIYEFSEFHTLSHIKFIDFFIVEQNVLRYKAKMWTTFKGTFSLPYYKLIITAVSLQQQDEHFFLNCEKKKLLKFLLDT